MIRNITDPDDNVSGASGPAPAPETTSAPPSQPSVNDRSDSSISQSESSQKLVYPDSSNPYLEPPSNEDFEALVHLKQQEIASSVLDKWLDDVQKEGERMREQLMSSQYRKYLELHSPAFFALERSKQDRIDEEHRIISSPDYLAWVASLSPVQQASETQYANLLGAQRETQCVCANYVASVVDGKIDANNAVAMVAAGFAIGTTSTGDIVTTKELGQSLDMNSNVFKDLWQQITPQGVATDIRADILGLIGATMMVRMTAAATANTALAVSNTQQQAPTKKFADEYAKSVIQLVKGSELDQTAKDMLSGQAKKPEVGTVLLKISFLATAIALHYKVEAGKITGEEFEGMLNGTIKLDPKDPKSEMIGLLSKQLAALPNDLRNHVVNFLFTYMNQAPQVQKRMTEAANLYTKLLASTPVSRPITD